MPPSHWLDIRDKPATLLMLMEHLAGGAHISFEGDLSNCTALFDLPESSRAQTAFLRSCTLVPELDFVVLPLEPDSVRPIFSVVELNGRVVREIVHIQIEKQGVLQLGAYDQFHRDCVIAGPGVSEEFLTDLKRRGLLRNFDHAPNPPSPAGGPAPG